MSHAPTESSAQPRRVRRPSWVDSRLLIGTGLVLASVLIGARVVGAADRTYAAVVITHDAQQGTILGSADLGVVRVRLPANGRGLYVVRPVAAIGKQISRPLTRGELVPIAALGSPPALTRIEVPLAPDAAPPLAAGEQITLWLSSSSCPPVQVLAAVTVQRVREAVSGSFGAGAGQAIDISVAPELADRVVTALSREHAQVRVGVLTGQADSPGQPLPSMDCPEAGTTS